MKQPPISGQGRQLFPSLGRIALICGALYSLASCAKPQLALSPEGQGWLSTAIHKGSADLLRWPNFSDYAKYVQDFYANSGNSLRWVKGRAPTPQARQLIAQLLQAGQKGLSAEDYDGSRWSDRLAKLKPAKRQPAEADAVQFDLALTVCAMRYISDLHIGRVNPKHFAFAFDEESKKYNLAEFLRDHIVDGKDVAGALAQVEPPYPGYRRTIQALQTYRELAKQDGGEQFPPVKKGIVAGDAYAGVARLTGLLRLVGDLPADADVPVNSTVYQGAMVDAVKKFQSRHGRDPNGRIDAQTMADLNVPLSRRVEQLQLTLERWRWLPDSYREAPIVVNIPEFRLRAYDKDFNIGVTMKVVVGKSYGHNTPVFSGALQYVIFRPYWEVPFSIVRAELIPHLVKDSNYLAAKGFEVVDASQKVVSSGAVSSEVLAQIRGEKLFIRQLPGPKNALGLVKFLFPNSYDVYMHDTPATELFARSRRDFSHGCIRLEKPAELAAWVLRDKPDWNPERIRAAMNGSAPQQVNLAQPIPVLIVYATAIVLEDGLVHFFDDIYEQDAALQQALEKGYPYPW
jgi:murein L,D-transpeptidase YcbB/YkuD